MSEKKKGLMWKPPIELDIGEDKVKIYGFMPLPAALCLSQTYTKDGTIDQKKVSVDMIHYFLKQCVIEPQLDDEYLKNSDSVALMELFQEILKRVQTTKKEIREIKKTMPTKP